MDEHRFDTFTRALGNATSRRQLLKGLLGGAAAVIAGVASLETAAAHSRTGSAFPGAGSGKSCSIAACLRENKQLLKLCSSNCSVFCNRHGFEHQECAACQLACFTASKIGERECRENSGCGNATCCDEVCVDTETDSHNCGGCGVVCTGGRECQFGDCQCADGQESCGSYCADLNHDADNCGACGVQCGSCETCEDGVCSITGCGEGGVCCNSTCVPACPDGETLDQQTCQCVDQCGAGCDECQQCVNGQCQPAADGTPCFSGDNLCCGGQCGSSRACGYVQNASGGPFIPTYCCSAGLECTPYGQSSDTCCPTDNNGITPDGQCCPPGSDPVSCAYPNGQVTYECCTYPAQGMNECNCCGGCCDNVTCDVHML